MNDENYFLICRENLCGISQGVSVALIHHNSLPHPNQSQPSVFAKSTATQNKMTHEVKISVTL